MKTQTYYHEDADILEVFFSKNEATAAVELTPDIVLQFRVADEQPIGLIFNNYSALVQTERYGQRTFRLQAERWPPRLRATVWRILANKPVSDWLATSSYRAPRVRHSVPLATVKQPRRLSETA